MKKDVKSVVFGVLIALSLFVLAMNWLGLLFNFVAAPDLLEVGSSLNAYQKAVKFMQWASLSLFCLLVPTILGFVLSSFTKNKILDIAAVALGGVVILCCIIFIAVPSGYHHYGENSVSEATLLVVTEIWEMVLTVLIPTAILTGFAVAKLVKGGKSE